MRIMLQLIISRHSKSGISDQHNMKSIDSIKKLQQLYFKSPKPNLINWEVVDSDSSTYTNNSMSVHYSIGCGFSEMITHCYWIYGCKECVDLRYCYSCESSYQCVDCFRCYNANYCSLAENCSFISNCYYIKNSSYCFGCVGIQNKTYYIFNKPYTQAEYDKELARVSKWPKEKIHEKIEDLLRKTPMPAIITHDCLNVTGNHLDQCQDLTYCFDCYRSRDSMYCFNGYENINCVDNSFTKSTFCYETVGGGMNYNSDFCLLSESCQDCFFCYNCRDCRHCFGCVNLLHKQYYIFNEPYSERDYFEKIVLLKKEFQDAGMFNLDVFDTV